MRSPRLLGSVVLPALAQARKRLRRTKCASNLKCIGYALHLYSSDYNDQFPDSLEVLFEKEYLKDPRVFRCDSRREPAAWMSDYEYVEGLSAASDAECVLMYDGEGNHSTDGRNVLFVGGNVEWRTESGFQAAMATTREHMERRGGGASGP